MFVNTSKVQLSNDQVKEIVAKSVINAERSVYLKATRIDKTLDRVTDMVILVSDSKNSEGSIKVRVMIEFQQCHDIEGKYCSYIHYNGSFNFDEKDLENLTKDNYESVRNIKSNCFNIRVSDNDSLRTLKEIGISTTEEMKEFNAYVMKISDVEYEDLVEYISNCKFNLVERVNEVALADDLRKIENGKIVFNDVHDYYMKRLEEI